MRWLRRRHHCRIITGYQTAWHPLYGFYDQVIYRGCICSSPIFKHTAQKETT